MIEQLVIYLNTINEKKLAINLLDVLAKNSESIEQYDEIAKSYFKLKEYNKSLKYAEKVLSLVSDNKSMYSSKYNVINVANHANYPERALTLIKQMEIINPNDTDLELEKAFSYFLLNKKDKAEEILRNQLKIVNDEKVKTKIKFNLGTYELLRDEFQSGLQKFLFEGRKLDYWKKPELPFERWNGEIIKNQHIVIRSEAGIGDEFINIRFMNHFKNLGMIPIWYTERNDLSKIFNRNNYKTITDIKQLDKNINYVWVHSMDIPVYLDLQYSDLWYGSYINPDDTLVEKWKSKLNTDKLKIGLRWQGNPEYDQDLHRSVPLDEIYNSIKHIDATFYSIQRDTGLEEIKDMPIVDLSKDMVDFDETLAIIENLDLVITSCTSIVHAASSMGKCVILLTPISSYYTWCHSLEKSPWYGNNLTILRQETPRKWNEPLLKLRKIVNDNYNR